MQRCPALFECQLLGTCVIGIHIGLRPRPNGLLRRDLKPCAPATSGRAAAILDATSTNAEHGEARF